jgi:hypothetical protein
MNTSWGVLSTRPQDLCESNADDSLRIVSLKNTDLWCDVLPRMGWHPLAGLQLKFTQKKYTEYRERNIHNNVTNYTYITILKKLNNLGSAGLATPLRVIPWHLPYDWGKITGKPLVLLKLLTILYPCCCIQINSPLFIPWMLMCSGDTALLIRNFNSTYVKALVYTLRPFMPREIAGSNLRIECLAGPSFGIEV